jgi:hypothetical protein
MCSLYMNEYRHFKLAGATMGSILWGEVGGAVSTSVGGEYSENNVYTL